MNPELGPIVREVLADAGSTLALAALGGGVLGLLVGVAVVAVLTLVGALGLPGRYGRFGTVALGLVVAGIPLVAGVAIGAAWAVRPAAEHALVHSELGVRTVGPMGAAVADAVLAAAAARPGTDEAEAVRRRDRFRAEGLPLAELDAALAAWTTAASSGTADELQARLDASLRQLVEPATAARLRTVLPQLALALGSASAGAPTEAWEARVAFAARDGVADRLAMDELAAWAVEAVVVPTITAPLAGFAAAVASATVTLVGLGWAFALGVAFLVRWAWTPPPEP